MLADKLLSNKDTALDTLAREELGIDPEELGGSAWQAGASSFLLFSLGAIVPVAPFIFLADSAAFVASLAASAMGLMTIGVGTSLFTGRSMVFSAFRQVAIGAAAAAITYGVGRVVGVSLRLISRRRRRATAITVSFSGSSSFTTSMLRCRPDEVRLERRASGP